MTRLLTPGRLLKVSESNKSDAAQLPSQRYWQTVGLPQLLTFDVALGEGGQATIAIEYELPVQPLKHPLRTTEFGTNPGVSQLVVVLDSFARTSNIPVSISLPSNLYPVITPPPEKKTWEQERCIYQMPLDCPQQNVHMTLIDVRTPQSASAYLSRFDEFTTTIETVENLEAETNNLTVKPLLRAARYQLLLREGRGLEAHKFLLNLRKTNPDSVELESLQNQITTNFLAKEAQQLYEWIERKSRSPQLEGDNDFNRFHKRSTNDTYVLDADDLATLAKNVQSLKDSDLSVEERLGRRFMLCQAGMDREENLGALLGMAKSDGMALRVLHVLKAMTVDKPEALPFVLQQIKNAKWEKNRVGRSNPAWQKLHARYNAGYSALRTFRSPHSRPRSY